MFKKISLFLLMVVLLIVLTISPVLAESLNLTSGDSASNLGSGYGLVITTAATNTGTHLSAEYLLSSLAQDRKNQRVLGSTILIASGGALIGIGALAFNDPYYEESGADAAKMVFYISGGVLCGIGLINLAIPTLVEREYAKVLAIKDPSSREDVAYGSLVSLAEKAKYQRLVSGLSSAGLCVYYLLNPIETYSYDYNYVYTSSNYYLAASFGISAIYSLLVKSPEESMLDRYNQSNSTVSLTDDKQKVEAFQIKIAPYQDGLSARLLFNY